MTMQYLEIVSVDVEATVALYERLLGLTFDAPDPDLGSARVARQPDGSLVGVRAPLAAHEDPTVRAYLAVEDIERAVRLAQELGATLAYGPAQQGVRGTFAIFFQGGAQHGLWQPPAGVVA